MSRRLLLLPCVAGALAVLVWVLARPEAQPAAPSSASPGMEAFPPQAPGDAPVRQAAQDAVALPTTELDRRTLATLEGKVRVAEEGLPLADVLVRIEGGPASTTDAQGRFALSGLPSGPLRVHAEAGESFLPLTRELAPGTRSVELELVPRFDLSVVVVGEAAGNARERILLAGARARLRDPRLRVTAEPDSVHAEGVTDGEGRCELRDLPPGEHELVVEREGYATARLLLSFRHGDRRTSPYLRRGSILVALDRDGIVLSGRVLGPNRSPVPGALVCLDDPGMRRTARLRAGPRGPLPAPRSTFSDATGCFELTLPEGESELALLACTTQEGLSPVARAEIPYRNLAGPVVVHVPVAASVELRVVDASGLPARGRLQVSDGVLSYDLLGDLVLAAVPGLAEGLAPQPDPRTGVLRLRLPDGGYRVRFDGDGPSGALGAWYVQVGPRSPREHELRLPTAAGVPTPSGL